MKSNSATIFSVEPSEANLKMGTKAGNQGWLFDAPSTYVEWCNMFNASYSGHKIQLTTVRWSLLVHVTWQNDQYNLKLGSNHEPGDSFWKLKDGSSLGWYLLEKKAALWDYKEKKIYYAKISLPDPTLSFAFRELANTNILHHKLLEELSELLYPEWAKGYYKPQESRRYLFLILKKWLEYLVNYSYLSVHPLQINNIPKIKLEDEVRNNFSPQDLLSIKDDFVKFINGNVMFARIKRADTEAANCFYDTLPDYLSKWVTKHL